MRGLAASVGGAIAVFTLACSSTRGIPSYDPCVRDEECAWASDRCVEVVFPSPAGGTGVASMCTTQGCVGDRDCPADPRGRPGACLAFEGALATCFERCERLADCAEGWRCEAVAPSGGPDVRVCVPTPRP